MNAEFELDINGERRKHQVRLELEVELGRAAPRVSMRNYDATLQDPGEPGGVDIMRGFVQRARRDKTVSEKPIPAPVLAKMRSDQALERWLYDNTIGGFPNA